MAALLASVPACGHEDTGQVASRKNVTSQALDVERTLEFLELPAFASGDGAQILRRLLPNGDRAVNRWHQLRQR